MLARLAMCLLFWLSMYRNSCSSAAINCPNVILARYGSGACSCCVLRCIFLYGGWVYGCVDFNIACVAVCAISARLSLLDVFNRLANVVGVQHDSSQKTANLSSSVFFSWCCFNSSSCIMLALFRCSGRYMCISPFVAII